MPSEAVEQPSVLRTMAASSLASGLARLPCHPIDTVKSRLQVQGQGGQLADGSKGPTGMLSMFRNVLATEGPAGLYRGIGVTLPGSVPAGCLYFTSYEVFKKHLGSVSPEHPALASLSAGFLAEVVSCVLWVPIDVVKERMQVQSTLPRGAQQYTSSFHAFRTICLQEGLGGIYRGYMATLYSFGPFSALYFSFYEEFKTAAAKLHNVEVKHLPMPTVVACSAAGGSAAAWLSSPLDMIKLRIQVQRRTAAGSGTSAATEGFRFSYKGVTDGLLTVAREEGIRALFKGAATRVCFMAPNMTISMVGFEWAKRLLRA